MLELKWWKFLWVLTLLMLILSIYSIVNGKYEDIMKIGMFFFVLIVVNIGVGREIINTKKTKEQ